MFMTFKKWVLYKLDFDLQMTYPSNIDYKFYKANSFFIILCYDYIMFLHLRHFDSSGNSKNVWNIFLGSKVWFCRSPWPSKLKNSPFSFWTTSIEKLTSQRELVKCILLKLDDFEHPPHKMPYTCVMHKNSYDFVENTMFSYSMFSLWYNIWALTLFF